MSLFLRVVGCSVGFAVLAVNDVSVLWVVVVLAAVSLIADIH